MRRSALYGTGALVLAAGIAAAPVAAGAQEPTEAKELLLAADFAGDRLDDPAFIALGDACLTGMPADQADSGFAACDTPEGQGPEPGHVPGYLQLTDARYRTTGGILYDKALEPKGDIEITFAQYQYGGTGADGISFFLIDGEANPTDVGAYGGSLGYAQHEDIPGIEGGYLGLGLDAWGNFSADTENRGNNCPEDQRSPEHLTVELNRAPDNVALRGPGQGTEGYCLLATTATDEKIGEYDLGEVYGSSFDESLNSDDLADAKRLVKLKVTDDDHPKVTVDIDFLDGDGWNRVLEAQMEDPAPDTFKFGFASSTGLENDTHLIRHLRVETFA